MHGIFKNNNRNKRNNEKKEKKNNKNKNNNTNTNTDTNTNTNTTTTNNNDNNNNMMRTKNLKRDKGQTFFPCLVKVGLNSVVLCLSSLYISPFPVALIHIYINVYHFASFLWFVLARVCFKLLLKTLRLSWFSLRFETSEFSPPSCRMYWRVMWEKSKKSKWIEDVLAFNSPKARREMNLDDILYRLNSEIGLAVTLWRSTYHVCQRNLELQSERLKDVSPATGASGALAKVWWRHWERSTEHRLENWTPPFGEFLTPSRNVLWVFPHSWFRPQLSEMWNWDTIKRSYGLPMASLFRESKESSDATFFSFFWCTEWRGSTSTAAGDIGEVVRRAGKGNRFSVQWPQGQVAIALLP